MGFGLHTLSQGQDTCENHSLAFQFTVFRFYLTI